MSERYLAILFQCFALFGTASIDNACSTDPGVLAIVPSQRRLGLAGHIYRSLHPPRLVLLLPATSSHTRLRSEEEICRPTARPAACGQRLVLMAQAGAQNQRR